MHEVDTHISQALGNVGLCPAEPQHPSEAVDEQLVAVAHRRERRIPIERSGVVGGTQHKAHVAGEGTQGEARGGSRTEASRTQSGRRVEHDEWAGSCPEEVLEYCLRALCL